jgi:DNA-binding transcriptional LysR family regulator
MNLRFVEAFYWVVQLKSVTRAAEKLHLTQSAMSSRVSALESELGVLLLDRVSKQFTLTLQGKRFFVYAEKMLALQRDAKTEMGADKDIEMSLRVGVIESVLHSWLIPWLEQLRIKQPKLELELTVDTTPVLIEQVERGALDLIIAAMPVSVDGVRCHSLKPLEMVFVGEIQTHVKRSYSLHQLAEFEILTFQRGSQPHVNILDLLRSQSIEPKKVHAISSLSALVQLVKSGFGVATLPQDAVQRLSSYPHLKILKSDTRLSPLPVYLSYRSNPNYAWVDKIAQSALDFNKEAEKK